LDVLHALTSPDSPLFKLNPVFSLDFLSSNLSDGL
jgi:hypothetical protein